MAKKGNEELNGHVVGLVLKELVRRAIAIARSQVITFEVGKKMGYGGNMDDVFTTADKLAQESYVKSLRECFPGVEIVGEEGELIIKGKNKEGAFFTIDPIDGTRAYIRRQSHGVGTMVALVVKGEVEAAFVGDVNSQEIFGYRPGSEEVWRITHMDTYERMKTEVNERNLGEVSVLLREREKKYGEVARKTVELFKTALVDGGSVGIWAARMWKREVGALLLAPAWETPWDWSPVVGISLKLGYVFLEPVGQEWKRYRPEVKREKIKREKETLIIHESDLGRLRRDVEVRG